MFNNPGNIGSRGNVVYTNQQPVTSNVVYTTSDTNNVMRGS